MYLLEAETAKLRAQEEVRENAAEQHAREMEIRQLDLQNTQAKVTIIGELKYILGENASVEKITSMMQLVNTGKTNRRR